MVYKKEIFKVKMLMVEDINKKLENIVYKSLIMYLDKKDHDLFVSFKLGAIIDMYNCIMFIKYMYIGNTHQ